MRTSYIFLLFLTCAVRASVTILNGIAPPVLFGRERNNDDRNSLLDEESGVSNFFDRNIFVFCDGTWCGEETHTRTNLQLLYEFINNPCRAPRCQYFSGVGLNATELNFYVSGALASDMKKKILQAYKYIVRYYDRNRGDHIWLFGFSRGAFTVRYVAAMIDRMGIVDKKKDKDIDQECEKVLKEYRRGSFSRSGRIHEPHLIKFMGLFDTVQAEGLPDVREQFPYTFSDPYVSPTVQCVYQCACIHDRCKFFQQCMIGRDPSSNSVDLANCKTEEVWVPGCHYDVGRQFFHFGYGILARLVQQGSRFNPFSAAYRT